MITRSFYIALAAAVSILLVGGYVFRHSEAGSQLTVVVAFAVGFTLLNVLDDRDPQRRQRGR